MTTTQCRCTANVKIKSHGQPMPAGATMQVTGWDRCSLHEAAPALLAAAKDALDCTRGLLAKDANKTEYRSTLGALAPVLREAVKMAEGGAS